MTKIYGYIGMINLIIEYLVEIYSLYSKGKKCERSLDGL